MHPCVAIMECMTALGCHGRQNTLTHTHMYVCTECIFACMDTVRAGRESQRTTQRFSYSWTSFSFLRVVCFRLPGGMALCRQPFSIPKAPLCGSRFVQTHTHIYFYVYTHCMYIDASTHATHPLSKKSPPTNTERERERERRTHTHTQYMDSGQDIVQCISFCVIVRCECVCV